MKSKEIEGVTTRVCDKCELTFSVGERLTTIYHGTVDSFIQDHIDSYGVHLKEILIRYNNENYLEDSKVFHADCYNKANLVNIKLELPKLSQKDLHNLYVHLYDAYKMRL